MNAIARSTWDHRSLEDRVDQFHILRILSKNEADRIALAKKIMELEQQMNVNAETVAGAAQGFAG